MTIKQLFLCLFLPFSLNATVNISFLEVKGEHLKVGYFEDENLKKVTNLSVKMPHEENVSLLKYLSPTESDKKETVLYYIHAMWGNNVFFNKSTLRELKTWPNVDRIVVVLWHAEKLNYLKNWESALDKGKQVAPILKQLTTNSNKQNILLCHSMGHRFFEGVASELSTDNHFDLVLFMAADLDMDVFSNRLQILPEISDKIVLYVHEKDRLLQISKNWHKRDRLGLNIAEDPSSILDPHLNIEIVNLTRSKRKKLVTLSNHGYILTHPGVQQDIRYLLQKDKKNRDRQLEEKSPQYFELL